MSRSRSPLPEASCLVNIYRYPRPINSYSPDRFVPPILLAKQIHAPRHTRRHRREETAESFGRDIVKITTNGNYLLIAYGAHYDYSTVPHKWDGVFFTTKFSTSEPLSPTEHEEFVLPYLHRTAEVLKGHT